MAWKLVASNTQSFAASAVTTVTGASSSATFVFVVDTTAMALGDQYSVRMFTPVTPGGAVIQAWKGTWQNVQINPAKMSPPVASEAGISVTWESIAGSTTESFPWKLISI